MSGVVVQMRQFREANLVQTYQTRLDGSGSDDVRINVRPMCSLGYSVSEILARVLIGKYINFSIISNRFIVFNS